MAYEMKANSGSYFRNDKKQTDKHPDVKGSIKIECPHCRAVFEMWQSGWNNVGKNGTQYVSQSFQHKEEKTADTPPPTSETHQVDPQGTQNANMGNPDNQTKPF